MTITGKTINVIQGDYAISDDPDTVLTTVLGSCVAVCLTDRVLGIGGMNHFLLPDRSDSDTANVRYGAYAMELLINNLLKRGAQRGRLEAKLFGGAHLNPKLRDIGLANAQFARKFLADEGMPCIAESLGGKTARRLRYWPTTGLVKQLVVENDIAPAPVAVAPPPPKLPASDITLF